MAKDKEFSWVRSIKSPIIPCSADEIWINNVTEGESDFSWQNRTQQTQHSRIPSPKNFVEQIIPSTYYQNHQETQYMQTAPIFHQQQAQQYNQHVLAHHHAYYQAQQQHIEHLNAYHNQVSYQQALQYQAQQHAAIYNTYPVYAKNPNIPFFPPPQNSQASFLNAPVHSSFSQRYLVNREQTEIYVR